jgi:hypothetical protein
LFINRFIEISQAHPTVATFLIIACIVALGIGLGFELTKDTGSNQERFGEIGMETGTTTTGTPSPTPLPEDSPSIEGHYRYASIASDTGSCAQIGVYVDIKTVLYINTKIVKKKKNPDARCF